MDVRDRFTNELIAEVPFLSAEELERAAERVALAFAKVRAMPSHARRDALFGVAARLESDGAQLARIMAHESGKPITQARAEIARAVSTFRVASEEATRMTGEVMPLDITSSGEGYEGRWVRAPRGPVLGITPFNFPLNLVAHKVAPALACGASVLIKPAPQTPLTALRLMEIVRQAGFPEGALEVAPCDVNLAENLVRDPRFKVVTFTGSDRVGWHLQAIAGKKRVLLELGGNAAAIVHEDARDLAFAAERVVSGAFAYAGQVCIKVQRLYVHRPIAEAFISDVLERARKLEVRSPLDESAVIGPMIDEANAKRVEAWIEEAKGARVLLRGRRDGAKLGPTILEFEGSGAGNKVVDEEVFGPVLTVHVYDAWTDALRMADATRFGLQAGLFTDSRAREGEAFAALNVGGLIVGDVPTFRVDNMPYGGTRDSGLGREGVRFAMEELTERRLLVVRRHS